METHLPALQVAFRKLVGAAALVLLSLILGLAGLAAYWMLRPNQARVEERVPARSLAVLESRRHNSNTDLVFWRGWFYAVHQNSKYHFASKTSRLVLYRSRDAVRWEKIREFATREDNRDPKFAVIGDRLFLYALRNAVWTAAPHLTICSSSVDGSRWSPWETVRPEGWLFWRPKTFDYKTWYVAAYWKHLGRSALFRSLDGRNWAMVSVIHEGDRVNETAVEFLPDGRLVSAARLEGRGGDFGAEDAATLVAVSEYPYRAWSVTRNRLTRLDGPLLFQHQGRMFALGRFQPERDSFLFRQGSILSRKRTSLFQVEDGRLIHLSDLPSAGDTSYGGAVIQGNRVFLTYYTSAVDRDYPWIAGMFGRSSAVVSSIDLAGLASLAAEKAASKDTGREIGNPLLNYLIFIGGTLLALVVLFYLLLIRRRKQGGIRGNIGR